MTYRLTTLTLAALMLAATVSAQAQGLRLPASAPAPVPGVAQSQADYIVAVVNSEPITRNQIRQEIGRALQQLAQQGRPQPDIQALAPEVLENLINRKAQVQFARDSGLKVEESAINQAEQAIALQNQFDVAELHRRVVLEGQSIEDFRAELGDQILLQRVRERDVEARARVSDQEVAQFQREQQGVQGSATLQLNLAHILVGVPEAATAAQVEELRARAQAALDRAKAGEDFSRLVLEYSEATGTASTGQLGLRAASRYPDLFVQATRQLAVGDVAALQRSPAGFHVLKVVEKTDADATAMAITQSRSRHILLLTGPRLSESEARGKLLDFKKRVLSKQADFASLARENSQDGSAAKGGDLGWSNPGMFVPEFEDAMNRLAPGEISDPVVSRFGVHLIQLEERRKTVLSPEQQREAIRAMLREKKIVEAYQTWAQDIRSRAYVDIREPPL